MNAIRAGMAATVTAFALAAPAGAQSPYVGASAVADIVRFGSAAPVLLDGGGESFGGALRGGTAITDRWGIDIEFARPGEMERSAILDFGPVPLAASQAGAAPGRPGGGGSSAGVVIFPPIPPTVEVTVSEQLWTLTTLAWVSQPLGSRAEVVYLGGVAFVRAETGSATAVIPQPRILRLGLVRGAGDGRVTTYGAGPAVGIDVRVAMTEHLRFVPGLRLLVVDAGGRSGWIARPAVGVQWMF
jgi:hypothetical protein